MKKQATRRNDRKVRELTPAELQATTGGGLDNGFDQDGTSAGTK